MITDQEIKDEIFNLLKTSELAKSISGEIRKTGTRKPNSLKEDIVINVTANENGEIQQAHVNVNIYVPDVPIGRSKEFVEDGKRLKVLSKLAADFFESKRVRQQKIVKLESQHTYEDEGNQHFINNRLLYNIYNP